MTKETWINFNWRYTLPDPPSVLSKLNANFPIHKLHDPIRNYTSLCERTNFTTRRISFCNCKTSFSEWANYIHFRVCIFTITAMLFCSCCSHRENGVRPRSFLQPFRCKKEERLFSFLSGGGQIGEPWMRILLHSLLGNMIFLA